MTTKFEYAPDGFEYCRTSRGLPLSTSRGGESARTYPIGSRINNHSSAGDLESGEEKQRRRIAVAVRSISTRSVLLLCINLTVPSVRDVENERSNVVETLEMARDV